MKKLIVLKFLFLFLFALPLFNYVDASHKIFQDNFDDGNLDGWTVVRNPCSYNGQPALWQVIDKKIGIKINGASCVTEIMPNDTLWGNIGNDYSVEFDMQLVNGTDHNFAFRYTNANDWYDIHIQSPGSLVLQRVLNTEKYNTVVNGNFANGQTIHFKILVLGENIKIYIGNPAELVLDYPNAGGRFPLGRIALQASVGADPISETYFDNIVVTSIDTLNVTELKQTSEPWKSLEYDSASLWNPSDPTINAWGCALTSATMVLQYHGINKLPDGTTLDPGTLNSWLKNQSDGYIGTGWINWLAISRLSKLAKNINNITAFDALEYKRVQGENKQQLTTDLSNNIPGILEEPGHFIVAKGILDNTFAINDPYYNRYTLDTGYNNTFLSLGRYVPSNTNLSYLMFTVNPDVDIAVTNSSGQKIGSNGTTNYNEISGATYYTQQGIQDPVSGKTNSSFKVLTIPTPNDGKYTLSVSTTSATAKPFSLKLYKYDTGGSSTISPLVGTTKNNNPTTASFTYQQNSTIPSTLLASESAHLVISEIQTKGITADDEFIELYNPTDSAINLSTLPIKLHIISSSGVDQNRNLTFTNTTIPSHGFFLIGPNTGYTGTTTLDATYTTSANKLVDNGSVYISTSINTDKTGLIDLVGFGTAPSTDREGNATSNPSANISIERKATETSTTESMTTGNEKLYGNGSDTNNNSFDFIIKNTPQPQNSLSTTETLIPLLTNSSFENINNNYAAGWPKRSTSFRETTISYTGNASLKVTGQTNGIVYAYQNINLTPNTQYTLSAWVKTQNVTGKGVSLRYAQLKPTTQVFDTDYWVNGTTTDWKKIQLIFRTPSNYQSGRVDIMWDMQNGDIAWIDDINITATRNAKLTPLYADIIVDNGSFETTYLTNGTSYPVRWWSRATAFGDTTVSHTGTNSFKVVGPANGANITYSFQTITLEPNTTYTLSGWVKTQNVTGRGIGMRYAQLQPTTKIFQTNSVSGTNSWQQIITSFTTPPNYITGRLDLLWDFKAGDTAWIDDVQLIKF